MQVNKQQEKKIVGVSEGYIKYCKRLNRSKPELETLLKYSQHRETVLHEICSKKSFGSDKLQWIMKANGFSWDEENGEITKVHRSAEFDFEQDWTDRLGGSPIYGGVFVDFEDVFAIAIHRSKKTEGNAICSFFTNDPYVPVFSAMVTNIDKAKKNRELCIELTSKFIKLCPNIMYHVCTGWQLKRMIDKDRKCVRGRLDKNFVFKQLDKLERGRGLYKYELLKSCDMYRSDERFLKDCMGDCANVREVKDIALKIVGEPSEQNKQAQYLQENLEPLRKHYDDWLDSERGKVEKAKKRKEEKELLKQKGNIIRKSILVIVTLILGFVTYSSYLNYERTVDLLAEPEYRILGDFFVMSALAITVWVFLSEKLSQCDDEKYIWKIIKVIGLEECIAIVGFTVLAEDGNGIIMSCVKDTFSSLGNYVGFLNSFFSSQFIIGIAIKVLTILLLVGAILWGAKEYELSIMSLVAKFILVIAASYILFFVIGIFTGDMPIQIYIRGWYVGFAILSAICFYVIYYILQEAPRKEEQTDDNYDDDECDEEENRSVKEKIKIFLSKDYWDFGENKWIYFWFGIGIVLYVVSVIIGKIEGWNDILMSVLETEYVSVNESANPSDAYGAIFYFYSTFVAMVVGVVLASGKKKRKNGVVYSINCLLYAFLFQVWGMNWCVDKLMVYYENGVIDSSLILSGIMNRVNEFMNAISVAGGWKTVLFFFIVLCVLVLYLGFVVGIACLFSAGIYYLVFCILINVLVYKLLGLVLPDIPGFVNLLLTWGINYFSQFYISSVWKEFFECIKNVLTFVKEQLKEY